MTNFEDVSNRIYGIITGQQHQARMYTEEGVETTDPTEARRFFVSDPNYMVTLDQDSREIIVNRNKHTDLEDFSKLMKKLRMLSNRHMLKTNLQVFGRQIKPKDYAMQARLKAKKSDEVLESAMYGTRKTSYQALEDVKVVVKHKQDVDEEQKGSRSRGIKSIYIEANGERTRFPYPLLTAARAMARHISKGGDFQDEIGQHIMELTEEMVNLREFNTYARTLNHNQQSDEILNLSKQQYKIAKEKLKKYSGKRTYEDACKEATASDDTEVTYNSDDVKDLFTVKHIDQRVEAALPFINNIIKEKLKREKRIQALSEKPFYVRNEQLLPEDEVIRYYTPEINLGKKLECVINSAQEQNELSEYIKGVAEKLMNGKTVTEFDKKIMKNFLENVKLTIDK